MKKYFDLIIISCVVLFGGIIINPALAQAWELVGEPELVGVINVATPVEGLQITGTGTEPIPVKLLVTNGVLAMTTTTGLTFDGPTTGATLYFTGSLANINNALETLTYTRTSVGTDIIEVSLVEPGEVFFPGNGHLYEYISAILTWNQARDAAALQTRYGATGYLTTITSQEENDFVADRLANAGWMGASDITVENEWRWVTGPESGEQFWQGDETGSVIPGAYENWNMGEPNDSSGNEDCGQFLAGGSGMWNDLPCTLTTLPGYVVEFGAPGNMPDVTATNIEVQTLSLTAWSLQIIQSYADDGVNNPVPTVADYVNAGVVGVTSDNIATVNNQIAAGEAVDFEIIADVQAVVNVIVANDRISEYSQTGGTSAAPTVADYNLIGITGVDADNLLEVNQYVSLDGDDPSLETIQASVNQVLALEIIREYSETNGASAAPTVADYETAGIEGVTTSIINAINQRVAHSDGDFTANELQLLIQDLIPRTGGAALGSARSHDKNRSSDSRENENDDQPRPNQSDTIESIKEFVFKHRDLFIAAHSNGAAFSEALLEMLDIQVATNTEPEAISEVRDLTVGDEGDDVIKLQKLLITKNVGPAAIELSSIGATGFFAGYTRDALAEYQSQYGVDPAVGYFGTITRAQMKLAGLDGLWW